MPGVTVRLPRVLCELTSCERQVDVTGETLGEALDDLVRKRPALGQHLFDDTGAVRRHVLCFCNEVAAPNRAELDQPLAAGDEITIVNSVAGG
jgi:molybdopterin synthase sulfur carrier subunit